MAQHRRGRNIRVLGGIVLLAIIYSSLLYALRTLTGKHQLDGVIGVLLGLYICSHPAANMVDMFFFERDALSGRSSALWLALNTLVLLIGWIVIVIGATRLVSGAA